METERKCAYCGTTDPNAGIATHSATEECTKCWNYRKLDYPAALHWKKVSEAFLSNVDMHDWMTYLPKRCGLTTPQMSIMLNTAEMVWITSRFLQEHGPEHRWSEETKAEYDKEMTKPVMSLARYTITEESKTDG